MMQGDGVDVVSGALAQALVRSLRPLLTLPAERADRIDVVPAPVAAALARLGSLERLRPGAIGALTPEGLIAAVEEGHDGTAVVKVYDTSGLLDLVLGLQRDVHVARSDAHLDELTGVLNRRGFTRQMQIAMAAARRYAAPLSLLVFDLDGFKRVNDTFGHAAGDAVLREIGSILRAELRAHVDLPARLGGDEFAVGLPQTGLDGARLVADRLSDRILACAGASVADGRDGLPAIGLSCGIVAFDGAEELERLLARADAEAYVVKWSKRVSAREDARSPTADVSAPDATPYDIVGMQVRRADLVALPVDHAGRSP